MSPNSLVNLSDDGILEIQLEEAALPSLDKAEESISNFNSHYFFNELSPKEKKALVSITKETTIASETVIAELAEIYQRHLELTDKRFTPKQLKSYAKAIIGALSATKTPTSSLGLVSQTLDGIILGYHLEHSKFLPEEKLESYLSTLLEFTAHDEIVNLSELSREYAKSFEKPLSMEDLNFLKDIFNSARQSSGNAFIALRTTLDIRRGVRLGSPESFTELLGHFAQFLKREQDERIDFYNNQIVNHHDLRSIKDINAAMAGLNKALEPETATIHGISLKFID